MMKYFTLVVLSICLWNNGLSQNNPSVKLDNMIKQGMKDWNIPGLATVVVKDGEVVFKKSYGIRNINTNEAVDNNTLFNMGSTTKAMVAMCLGMLVDEGKLDWNDKVVKYVPEFELSDPYITENARVKDLLTHNLGIENADILWTVDSISTEEIIDKFKYSQKVYPLRGGFIYQNIMYVVAGEVIKSISGQHWADFIDERLFSPLDMDRTQSRSANIFKTGNYVSPHFLDKSGELIRVNHTLVDQIGAAGLIWSSINDISNYLLFIDAGGVFKNDTILKPSTFNYLFEPQVILPPSSRYPTNRFTQPSFNSYGLGWFQQDYRGRKLDFHTGSLNGLIAITGVIHDENFAVYMFGNLDHAELRHAILYKAIDLFVFDDDSRNWHKNIYQLYNKSD